MTSNDPMRPDTPMGRALAARALRVADQQESTGRIRSSGGVDLTVPEPRDAPQHVRAAAKDALDRGETHYTTRPGIIELRDAVATVSTAAGFPATAENTVVTNGGSEALYIALQCTVSAGATVGIAGPVAPNVIQMIEFMSGSAVQLTGAEEAGFYPEVAEVGALDAAVLLITSPSPIAGRALDNADLQRILAHAQTEGIEVILDRSSGSCSYEPEHVPFPNPELGAYPIIVGSFSNSHGLAGWRIGFFTAPERLMGKLRNLKQAMSICTTAVSQFAALAAITGPDEWLDERRADFRRRRRDAVAALETAGIRTADADYFPSVLVDVRSLGSDDRELAAALAQHSIAVDPGSDFGSGLQGFLRLDLGVDEASLDTGVQRIARLPSERSEP